MSPASNHDERQLTGAVLLGGASSRFGSDKSLASVGDKLLGAVPVKALRDAGLDPVVAIGGSSGHRFGLVTVADQYPGEGPLGGLLTALRWARVGSVLMVACDLALLRSSDLMLLVRRAQQRVDSQAGAPVVATVGGVPDVSVAVWPTEIRHDLAKRFGQGTRALRAALDDTEWIGVEVSPGSLADADTPEELERLVVAAEPTPDDQPAGPAGQGKAPR